MGGTWTEGGSCDDCQPAADECPADVDGDGTIRVLRCLGHPQRLGRVSVSTESCCPRNQVPPVLGLRCSDEDRVVRAGCGGVGTAGMDHWRPAWGNRHCFHSWRPFRPVDGVGTPATTFMAV